MAITQEFVDHILDQLSELGEVRPKKMFGGYGLFHDDLMFGMIASDGFRLKADDMNRGDYEARGMTNHAPKNKKGSMPYYEVPEDVLEDKATLAEWASKAFDAARRGKR